MQQRPRTGPPPESEGASQISLDYRADLDGMRGVAVVAVLLYHLEQSWLPGGYVGVDVFFVLSGYFITRILMKDIDAGSLSLLAFYDRRIRRLLPALLAMLFVVLSAGVFVMAPSDLERLAIHTFGAAFSVNNIVLWQSSGYFAPAAESLPLLHTWSLAVEEQFYLFYPVVLLGLARFARRQLVSTLLLLSLVSLGLSVWLSAVDPDAAFYLPFSRFWELSLGGLIVFVQRAHAGPGVLAGEIWRALGLAAIGLSLFTFDAETVFPGYMALLPCIGTAMIIWARPGAVGKGRAILAQTLSLRPLVFVGLISYSLYLWHWPVFVFGNQMTFDQLSPVQMAGLVLVSFAFAYASWRLVERPLRKPSGVWSPRRRRFRDSLLAAGTLGLVSTGLAVADGLPARMQEDARRMADAANASSPLRPTCHLSGQGRETFEELCRFGPDGAPEVFIYADSHGTEIGYALSSLAKEAGFRFTQIASSFCPPSYRFDFGARKGCRRHNDRMMAALEQAEPSTVIVTAWWANWAARGDADRFWAGIEDTLERLRGAGHEVILLGPLQPYRNGELPAAVAKQVRLGTPPDRITFKIERRRLRQIETRLQSYAGTFGAQYVPLLEATCGSADRCRAVMNGKPIYFDGHHVTIDVAGVLVTEEIWPAIAVSLDGNGEVLEHDR